MIKKSTFLVAMCMGISVFAHAQSTVTISGHVKMGYENYKLTNNGPTAAAQNLLSDGGSRLIFSGLEDLGGGLKAWFVMDNRFQADIGSDAAKTGFAAGNVGVGFLGSWGKIGLGRFDLHYNEGASIEKMRAISEQTILSQGLMAQVNGNKIARVSRSSNTIRYDSLRMSGFSFSGAYSFRPEGEEGPGANDGSKGGAWFLAGRYNDSAIDAGISFWRYNLENRLVLNNDQRAHRAWFAYKFPFGLKIGAMFDQSKRRSTVTGQFDRRNAWMLPVSYSFGNNAVYLAYGKAGNLSNTVNTKASQWLIGYDYALSKRTSLGINYTKLNNDSAASYDFKSAGGGVSGDLTANGQDARQFYVGVVHKF